MKFNLDPHQQALSTQLINRADQMSKLLSTKFTNFLFRPKVRGMFIYGPVGSGKSMLLEEFYNNLENPRKILVHFHDFMQQVHAKIFEIRQLHTNSPIKKIAKYFAQNYQVICLDELEIDDITDAMIVGKLFTELLNNKVIIIITSNRHPDELYQDGLQRNKFLEFINIIKNQLDLFYLNHNIDYRLNKINSKQQTAYIPNNNKNSQAIDLLFSTLCENHPPHPHIFHLQGRQLTCNLSFKNIAKFTFDELCKESLGPADYIAICKYYRIIILTDIPILSAEQNNELTRFINLIDEIYEHGILLIYSAQAPLEQIYDKGRLEFKFKRTLSRLMEMQSQDYINQAKNWHIWPNQMFK